MKILFSPFSPYVRKCLVAAHELGLADRITLLPSNAHPVQPDPQIIPDNPLGKVPTFFTNDGRVLYDSRVICEYLDHLGEGRLFPREPDARWETLTLQSLGDGMLDACLLARYEDVARPEAMRWPDWRAAQLDKVETALAHLDGKPSLLKDRVDIGTLTVACACWYLDLRFPSLDWRDRHTGISAWYKDIGQRPSLSASWALPQ